MGEMITAQPSRTGERAAFVQHLMDDIKALEYLLDNDLFEDDVVRIGAEQEICLIDEDYRPFGINQKLLKAINDNHFTTELASYNIELNLDSFELKKDCFNLVEKQLRILLLKADKKAKGLGAKLLLAGILPTISKKEVGLEYLTPIPRYFALNDMLKTNKGGDFNLKIRGVDELFLKHDSVMFEACNTSFQLHLQIPSNDFISSYNWAQAIAGPVLSICCNSPLLMGRELWKETRIALFQQSLDTRKTVSALRNQTPRVGFGDDWESGSVAEIFKKDISKHRILLTKKIEENSMEKIKKGIIPELPALCLQNGTVYRWNRPCYGVGGGKPHLRIENRYIPAGPSVLDELANFAFWVGLMKGRPKQFDDLPSKMDFKSAKTNFIKAARTGKESLFLWCDEAYSAKKLVLNKLLPIAYKGLHKCGVDDVDIERFLGIIEARTKGRTGEQWQVSNYRKLKKDFKTDKSLVLLTKEMVQNQTKHLPIHQWKDIDNKRPFGKSQLVKELMNTHVLKLHENDYVSMAKAIMTWNNIRHIPVENDYAELTGILSLRYLNSLEKSVDFEQTTVDRIMVKEIFTIGPDQTTLEALELMKKHDIGCLPVVQNTNTLIGILSKSDLI
ncbi:CBS domain-containing protein [Croceivirga thetidis]|uniref:CBS domain-containing protein n=1 Tax=Croceivirga thetidis TaxID=2721623 RepID=A0ABX1GMY4_9FLAO|nr:CBS domain-containing protein [Croceivirga thetidis]NKI31277.1 CBS domain-containing protein [Croceivirga thetidis]